MKYEIIKKYKETRFKAITGINRGTFDVMVDVVRIGQFDVPDIRTLEEIEAENAKYEKIECKWKYKRECGRRQAGKKKNDGEKPPAA